MTISYFMIPKCSRNVRDTVIMLHCSIEPLSMIEEALPLKNARRTRHREREPSSRLDVAKHVILNTPLHRDWLPVFVLDSGCAAVAGVFLHFQLKFSVELGLCLHLLGLGCLNVIYIFASIGLSLGFDFRLLNVMSYRQMCV
jgi:hypothetical protein